MLLLFFISPHPSAPAVRAEPIETSKEDADNPARVRELYRQTRAALEGDIAWLRAQRERDPYRRLPRRLLYETFNRGKQAPTFPLPAAESADR